LFAQKHLTLTQSRISLETLSGKHFNYILDEFTIRNFEDKHQLSGVLLDNNAGELELVAEISGDPSLPESETKLFLQGRNVQLASLPIYSVGNKIRPDAGAINWRVWSDWENGRWQNAVGDFDIKQAEWLGGSVSHNKHLEYIESFDGKFNWYFENSSNGTFSLSEVNLKRKDEELIQLPDLYFLFKQQENFDLQWDLITHDLDVTSLIKYLDASLFDEQSKGDTLKKSDLKLNIDSFAIRFSKQDSTWLSPKLVTDFSNLSYTNLLELPKVPGLSGSLGYYEGDGFSELKAESTKLDFNGLFRNEIEIDKLNISLNWSLDSNDSIILNIDKANLRNSDFTLNATSQFIFQDEQPEK